MELALRIGDTGASAPTPKPMATIPHDHQRDLVWVARAKMRTEEGKPIHPEAAERLVRAYWRLANIFAKNFQLPGVSQEEKLSETLRGLTRAIDSFEEGRGCVFKTWAKRNMANALAEMHRKYNRKSEVPILERLSIDRALDQGDEEDTLGDTIAAADDTEAEALANLLMEGPVPIDDREQQRLVTALVAKEERVRRLRDRLIEHIENTDPILAARVWESLREDGAQMDLFNLGPEPGSVEATRCVMEALTIYLGAKWAEVLAGQEEALN
ncbi:hypothetical protein EON81_06950 [bacterium]|nr:MAG: hypothetical protein EON81_06950 [bacterium]